MNGHAEFNVVTVDKVDAGVAHTLPQALEILERRVDGESPEPLVSIVLVLVGKLIKFPPHLLKLGSLIDSAALVEPLPLSLEQLVVGAGTALTGTLGTGFHLDQDQANLFLLDDIPSRHLGHCSRSLLLELFDQVLLDSLLFNDHLISR